MKNELIDKKTIQEYWTKNVPGLDMVSKEYAPGQKEFYIDVDKFRYKNEPYIIPLIDSFAEKKKFILEVGCGMGTDSRYIAKKGANIVSLDLSFNNVSFALEGMYLLNLKGKGVNADAENLPFKDNTFDTVYSYGVLHHTPDTQKAINEIYRVLKPNGKCAVMLYHKGYAYYVLLFLYGYKKLLAGYNHERLMSRYDRTPLSKMYSKNEIRRLFINFKNLKLIMTTFGAIQAHPFLRYVYIVLQKSKFLMQRFGSFVIISGEK